MNYEEFLVTLSDITPKQAYYTLKENPNHEHKKGYELIISKNAAYSYHYARDIRSRFELGENAISKDAHYSHYYALEVVRGRFESGEDAISKNAGYSYDYAKYVMKNPNFWKNR